MIEKCLIGGVVETEKTGEVTCQAKLNTTRTKNLSGVHIPMSTATIQPQACNSGQQNLTAPNGNSFVYCTVVPSRWSSEPGTSFPSLQGESGALADRYEPLTARVDSRHDEYLGRIHQFITPISINLNRDPSHPFNMPRRSIKASLNLERKFHDCAFHHYHHHRHHQPVPWSLTTY